MSMNGQAEAYDYVVIGSGFGGSVAAMRLTQKGYRVLVLERGKRYRDSDFAPSNWQFWRYVWLPALRCFGILQVSLLKGVMVLHGSGVGGGSLGYANVLMVPDDTAFAAPAWRQPLEWQSVLRPHFATARRMLGVVTNPCLWTADHVLKQVAEDLGQGGTFRPTEVGVFFGPPRQDVPDPYFEGEGPTRRGCHHCGGCMVGCRHNAKNTLVKNYLYFAEQWGAEVRAEAEAQDIRPLPEGQADGARYAVTYRRTTALLNGHACSVRARGVVLAAGVLGTLGLLFRCRDRNGSLPNLSPQLGRRVRTNSEALLGVISRDDRVNFSEGVAITSIFSADAVTTIEPVRYPEGSSLMRMLGAPLIEGSDSILSRSAHVLWDILTHPIDFLRSHVLPGWARRTTIVLVMQQLDNYMRLGWGRSLFTLFRRGLVGAPDSGEPIPAQIDIGHAVTRRFAEKTGAIPAGSVTEAVLNLPTTAHILGGCPIGRSPEDGLVDPECQVFNYPGMYVVDGSIMPGNPGVNPSLTITALAEYAMSRIPARQERAAPSVLCPAGEPASAD